jgi:hypothetical protein
MKEGESYHNFHRLPELHQTVLERCTSEQQTSPRVEPEQRLPSLRSEVLDVMSLVKDQVVPRFASEHAFIGEDDLIRRDADVERIRRVPAFALFFPLLHVAVIREDFKPRKELFELLHKWVERVRL